MKPPPFEYARADTPEEAVALLAAAGGAAKLIAGGQSLMPMLNFRLLEPDLLVDIGGVAGLDRIEIAADGALILGAAARHRDVMTSDLVAARFPILQAAMAHVAHVAIRNRGTIGGSLAHADPAAEWPMLAMLLDAGIAVLGPGGERLIQAADFFTGALTTALAEDEMIVAVRIPPAPGGWGFAETARRAGDFALAGAGAMLRVEGGRIAGARLALMGVGDTPLRAAAAEDALLGRTLSEARDAAVTACRAAVDPMTDLQASAAFRRHLAGVMASRALDDAWARAA